MTIKTSVSVLAIFLLILSAGNPLADEIPVGTIKGKVVDSETKSPLPGVSISIFDTKKGSNSDMEGNFTINNVPVGNV